jgi:16S rRNA (uracil1498-N3)-methyltransferase
MPDVNAHRGEDISYPGGKLRLYVEAALAGGGRVEPSEGQTHYLLHVMRAKAGDKVRLFNGRDGEWLAQIADVKKRSCTLVCEHSTVAQSETPDIWLAFAPIKKTPADYVVQKATELGAGRLIPVFTRRTIVTRVNLERMRANAIEAAEQSDRLSVPVIAEPKTLQALLSDWPQERALIYCDEARSAAPIAEVVQAMPAGACAILTGPEGGFEPTERDTIRAFPGVVAVSLGPRILRADTAALAALSVWQSLKGDWR